MTMKASEGRIPGLFFCFLFSSSPVSEIFIILIHHFNVKRKRSESVIAADHRSTVSFHPAIKEITASVYQGKNIWIKREPGLRAETFRFFSLTRDPLASYINWTWIFQRFFIFINQILMDLLSKSFNLHFFHIEFFSAISSYHLRLQRKCEASFSG